MPVYNGASFIAQAIGSILAQSCPDWELIVVDDGSVDSTLSILAGFSDPRVRIIHQENRGEAVARNTGLNAAQG
jgi:glycosyltransferase involved in cell wall biosynthesis